MPERLDRIPFTRNVSRKFLLLETNQDSHRKLEMNHLGTSSQEAVQIKMTEPHRTY